jgi:hypothetical protein
MVLLTYLLSNSFGSTTNIGIRCLYTVYYFLVIFRDCMTKPVLALLRHDFSGFSFEILVKLMRLCMHIMHFLQKDNKNNFYSVPIYVYFFVSFAS